MVYSRVVARRDKRAFGGALMRSRPIMPSTVDAFHSRKRFQEYARQKRQIVAILRAYENDNSPIIYFKEPLSLPARCVAHSIRSRLLCAFADSASSQSATGRVLPE